MKSLLLYLLFFLGLVTLLYYIYLLMIGKRLARLMESKDRYIWNGLRNLNDSSFSKKSTVFLDSNRLIVAKGSLTDVYSKLRSGGLEDAIVMDFEQIVAFDYDPQGRFFLIKLFNRIFKVNNFILKIDYLLPGQGVQKLRFKASSMDPLDFESAFADFNNKIYGDKVLLRSSEADSQEAEQAPSIALEPQTPASEVTTALPITSFKEELSLSREESDHLRDELDFERTTILPLAELQEEPSLSIRRDSDVDPDVDLEKTTAISREELLEGFQKKEFKTTVQDDLEQTVALSPLTAPKDTEPEIVLRPEVILEKETVTLEQDDPISRLEEDALETISLEQAAESTEIKRRSFLDRKPAQKKSPTRPVSTPPIVEKAIVDDLKVEETRVVEDETIAVELPDELKRKDQAGMTEEEISAQEMERLKKLKEFFAKENSEEF